MSASYPSAIKTFTTKEDKVDLAQASFFNDVDDEVTAIETILGTNVQGSKTDLKTRLAVNMDTAGLPNSGSSFPGSPVARQLFYRTDQEKFYIRNDANTNWLELTGTNLSNLAFHYQAAVANGANVRGEGISTTSLTTNPTSSYRFLFADTDTSYNTVLTGKYKKISGVNTVTVEAQIWNTTNNGGDFTNGRFTIGSATALVLSCAATDITPTWFSGTIDVSSLTNDTIYDITIEICKATNNNSTPKPRMGSIFFYNS